MTGSDSSPPNRDAAPDLRSAAGKTDPPETVPVAEWVDPPTAPGAAAPSSGPGRGANIIEAAAVADPLSADAFLIRRPPPMPRQFDNLAANGCAITVLVLGAFAFAGAWFSDLAFINSLLAIPFARWGFASKLRKTTIAGVLLAVLAVVVVVAT